MCHDVRTSCLGMSHLYDSFARFVHIVILIFFFCLISATLCRRHGFFFWLNAHPIVIIIVINSIVVVMECDRTDRSHDISSTAHLHSILSQRSCQRFTTPLSFFVMAVKGLVTAVLFVCALFVRSLHRLSRLDVN